MYEERFEQMIPRSYPSILGFQLHSILNGTGQRDTLFISMHEDCLFEYREPYFFRGLSKVVREFGNNI